MGPLVSEEQLNRVLGFLEAGKADGVKTVVGGNRVGDRGYFVIRWHEEPGRQWGNGDQRDDHSGRGPALCHGEGITFLSGL